MSFVHSICRAFQTIIIFLFSLIQKNYLIFKNYSNTTDLCYLLLPMSYKKQNILGIDNNC